MLDPVSRALANAPIEDEVISQQEQHAVAEAREWLKHHKPIPNEEVLAEFGLTPHDFEKLGRTFSRLFREAIHDNHFGARLRAPLERPLVNADRRSLQIERQDSTVESSHTALEIASRFRALSPQPARFRFYVLRLLDPLRRDSIVLQQSMSHPVPGVFKWILAEIERLARPIQIIESAFLHSLPNLPLGDKVPLVHALSLP
jgi:hypothetical protein